MMHWLLAFVLTEVVEAPLYLRATREWSDLRRRWLVALGASAITHPPGWWLVSMTASDTAQLTATWFDGERWSWWLGYVLAHAVVEALILLVEALFLRRCGVSSPFQWALLANLASTGAGLLVWAARSS